MQIKLKESAVFPVTMMAAFTFYISVAFNAVEMQMASYMSLAFMALCSFFSIFLISRTQTIYRIELIAIIYFTFIMAVSLFSNTEWKDWTYICISIFLLLFSFNYYQDNIKLLLAGALIGFSLVIYLQLFQNITNPELWLIQDEKSNVGYIAGPNYNQIGCKILCALLTNLLCLRTSKWFWLNLVPLFVASTAILVMVQSMTSLSCYFLFIVLCLIPTQRIQRTSAIGVLVCCALFEVFVCFQGKGFENNDLARWFIVDILGKDMTFTHRTLMWDSALTRILDSPLWGYGYVGEAWYQRYMSSFAVGPHNMILGILLYGGAIGLSLFMYIFIFALSHLLKFHDRTSNIILTAISIFCIMSLMETYPPAFVFYMFVLCLYQKHLPRQTSVTGTNLQYNPDISRHL